VELEIRRSLPPSPNWVRGTTSARPSSSVSFVLGIAKTREMRMPRLGLTPVNRPKASRAPRPGETDHRDRGASRACRQAKIVSSGIRPRRGSLTGARRNVARARAVFRCSSNRRNDALPFGVSRSLPSRNSIAVDRAHRVENPAQHVHLFENVAGNNNSSLRVPDLVMSIAGKNALIRDLAVENDLGVAGALELLENTSVHAGSVSISAGGDNSQRAAFLDVAGRAKKALGRCSAFGVNAAVNTLPDEGTTCYRRGPGA